MADSSKQRTAANYTFRHLRFGWWSLLCFLTLGIVLETMHGFKIGWYLNTSNETRRLMLTLAHAHGTLLSLVHIGFGCTVHLIDSVESQWKRFASPCLTGASVLLPGGFFLGGLYIYGGDPGLGVFLVPVGAVLFFLAVLMTGIGVSRSTRTKLTSVDQPESGPAKRQRRKANR